MIVSMETIYSLENSVKASVKGWLHCTSSFLEDVFYHFSFDGLATLENAGGAV